MIQSLEELIVPGRVLRLFCSFTVPPKEKYVVIVATTPFCLGFLFNSSPTELQKSKKHLLDELISISARDGYAFLTNPEPSILDCTFAANLDFDETVAQLTQDSSRVLSLITELNVRADVHGILMQMPFPAHLQQERLIEALAPAKDVDALHPLNQGRLFLGEDGLRPCTPLGIMRLLDETGFALAGKKAVVIGRSILVGKPVVLLLLERHATVTCCHSRTTDLASEVRAADIVIAAVGRPGVVKGDWIKAGAIVIDVGISRLADGSLTGDVEFAAAKERAAFITPVPGGVGPMTVAMLLTNTLQAAERQIVRR